MQIKRENFVSLYTKEEFNKLSVMYDGDKDSDDVMLLLKLIFHRQDTQELLKKLLEREKPETP